MGTKERERTKIKRIKGGKFRFLQITVKYRETLRSVLNIYIPQT